ncbi:SMP-30/gluconolactonase/LRE family protein [Roseomonas sp. SSH11]|uniref:SMP-30/gluconolactonase/LRE family protein n=1 Tax=Pararoseomonas baculiformis TaxID=2820812 RepID=A0ABS4AAD4_9PROT|nr:SMP-30/gluconolactonase/LRE family protein [Pararoseomonas baculiformis]
MPGARILADGLRFPEGPVVLPDGRIALVEIEAGRITAIGPDGSKTVLASPGGGPNGLALGPDGMLYVCNNGGFEWIEAEGTLRPHGAPPGYAGGWVERIDPSTGRSTRLYDACNGRRLRGPNDLVLDGQGGFWFTDYGKVRAHDRDHGTVYWAALDGSRILEAAHPFPGGANGLGLSPDGRRLYVAETETGRLWAFDILGPGELRKDPWPSPHGGTLLCQFPGFRRLDSLAVTQAGNICVATLVSGEITTVSPEGRIIDVVRCGERMPTNICFGGEGRRTAYVTLSHTGKLLEMPWEEPGLALVA